uniref:Uncharacterized protein n=1 Tax=Arundo donax TaxID=35708 RepID=A0A0A9TZK9_ARUDO
MHQSAKESHEV